MNKVFILAGTQEQAKQLARWHDMAFSEWCYVYCEDVLRGKRNQTMWLCGTWAQRHDARACLDAAIAAGFKVFTIEDDRYVASALQVSRQA